jgi:DNA-binding ferritin-like protein (Dps family)
MPAPEVAWVVKYGDILRESVKITKQLMTETKKSTKDVQVPADKTRVIKNLPQEFVKHLEHVIKLINKKAKTTYAKERLIADVLDVLQLNMNLTPKQINQSVQLHKSQKRLQKYMEKL